MCSYWGALDIQSQTTTGTYCIINVYICSYLSNEIWRDLQYICTNYHVYQIWHDYDEHLHIIGGHWPPSLHLEEFPLLTRQPRCHEHDLMAKGIRGVAIVHHLPGDVCLRCSFGWIPSWNNWWLSSGDLTTHFDNVYGLIIKSFSTCILSDLEYQVPIRSMTILHRLPQLIVLAENKCVVWHGQYFTHKSKGVFTRLVLWAHKLFVK